MKFEAIIKSGGVPAKDFAQILTKAGAIIDVMAASEPALARLNWRMKGDSLEEAQRSEVYLADGHPSNTALEALESEYRGDTGSTVGIWDGGAVDAVGASVTVFACGGDFPDTVTIGARGAFSTSMALVSSVVKQLVLEFAPAVVTAAPEGYEEQQAFDDRPGVGWMLYLPVELTAQQIPEAQELIPVFSTDGKKRLGTILVSIKGEVFSVDNEEHLAVAHNIEARLISMDLLPLLGEI
ncbi:Imm52 family immunity protein [Burkholderia ubonensis]|uniref:Imm52 family immunity protein n=1 Tax=Burkholderia ubonensis TaxID=101571 RepID=UPI0007C7435D|nr:Imm52 family immunity protein [Burkholderia ubonensis]